MFYSHDLLKKGTPLGQIWIFAHNKNKKITRAVAGKVSITDSIKSILEPAAPLALRLSAVLMNGVVILFSKKQQFLLEDITSFLTQVQSVVAATPESLHQLTKDRARADAITVHHNEAVELENLNALLLLEGDAPMHARAAGGESFFTVALTAPRRASGSSSMGRAPTHRDSPHLLLSGPSRSGTGVTEGDARSRMRARTDAGHDGGGLDLDAYADAGLGGAPRSGLSLPGSGGGRRSGVAEYDLPPLPEDRLPEAGPMDGMDYYGQTAGEAFAAEGFLPPPGGRAASSSGRDKSSGPSGPLGAIAEGGDGDVRPTTPEAKAPTRKRAPAKRRAALVDDDGTDAGFMVPRDTIRGWLQDASTIHVTRPTPLKRVTPLEMQLTRPCAINPGDDDTPAWCTDLADLWSRRVAPYVAPPPSKRKKGGSPVADAPPPAEEDVPPPPQDDYRYLYDDAGVQPTGPPGEALLDVERLRKALSSPGALSAGGFERARLGVTPPGSAAAAARPISAPTSGTGSLARDVARTAALLRSGGPSSDGRPSSGDDLLPMGGDVPMPDTMPSLLEDSGRLPFVGAGFTQGGARPQDALTRTTFNILTYVTALLDGPAGGAPAAALSLHGLCDGAGLRRDGAAKVFYHLLVLRSTKYVTLAQGEPYADVVIGRGPAAFVE